MNSMDNITLLHGTNFVFFFSVPVVVVVLDETERREESCFEVF